MESLVDSDFLSFSYFQNVFPHRVDVMEHQKLQSQLREKKELMIWSHFFFRVFQKETFWARVRRTQIWNLTKYNALTFVGHLIENWK